MIKEFFVKIKNLTLNFLFPQKCIGCGKENCILCSQCLERIDYPTLIKDKNVWAATDYNDVLAQKAIWMLKYRSIKSVAEPLAELIYKRLMEASLPIGSEASKYVLIPVPLSYKRLKKRGFNQTELIAGYLSQKSNFPVITSVLYKIKETSSQVSLKDKKKRLENLAGSFELKNSQSITGKNIILIDDVSTTGATINEAIKVLREARPRKIMAMVVARG